MACQEGEALRLYSEDGLQWQYLREGGMNMVLKYVGRQPDCIGHCLRMRKGNGSNAAIAGDIKYSQQIVAPCTRNYANIGRSVEIAQSCVCRLNEDDSVQQQRPEKRRFDKNVFLDATDSGATRGHVLGILVNDLSACPGGQSFEIKPKTGVLEIAGFVPRFTLQQFEHLSKGKVGKVSRYSPVELFQGLICGHLPRVLQQLALLREASNDPQQNNFRLLNGDSAAHVSDESLGELAGILLSRQDFWRRLRALQLLSAGQKAEASAYDSWQSVGAPATLPDDAFYQTYVDILSDGVLLQQLEQNTDDVAALECVQEERMRLAEQGKHVEALALFLIGRTFMDCSVIVNMTHHVEDASLMRQLQYFEVDGMPGLWGRISIIDTDRKPVSKMGEYGKQLANLLAHPHAQLVADLTCTGELPCDAVDHVIQQVSMD